MSQTSSTPGHVQSRDARQHQALLEENQRLKEVLKETQDEMEVFKEDLAKERADTHTLRVENRRLRSSAHGTSSDQISIQQWRDRAEEAEHRAEEAKRLAEEAKRLYEVADRGVVCLRDGHFPELFQTVFRGMMRTFIKKGQQIGSSFDLESMLRGEVKVARQGQVSAQAIEGEKIDSQDEDGNPAGEVDRQSQANAQAIQGEKIDTQYEDGKPAGEVEESEWWSSPKYYPSPTYSQENEEYEDPSRKLEDFDEVNPEPFDPASWGTLLEEMEKKQANDPIKDPVTTLYGRPYEGTPFLPYGRDIGSIIDDDYQGDASEPRVRLPGAVNSRSPQELSSGDLKGASSQPSPSQLQSMLLQPQQHQSALSRVGETTRPGDQHTPLVSDTSKMEDEPSPLENLGAMQKALPTLSGSSKPTEQAFPDLPQGSSQIPGIPTASTAPPIQKRPTPIPAIQKTSWEQLGLTTRKGTRNLPSGWSSEDESDEEQKPKPEVKATTPVAAGKQPERPSPAKEASSAIKGEPPKQTSTQSYAGATIAPPPKVEVGSAQTASRTVLKPGNATAKAAVPPTDAPPVNQADENTDSGYQTVGSRKARDSSGRGRGSLGRGEAGSDRGGQGPKFGHWQYDGRGGRGGRGGNPKGGNRRAGNQGGNQGQART